MLNRTFATVAAGLALTVSTSAYAAPFVAGSFTFTALTPSTTDVATTTVFPLLPFGISLSGASGDFLSIALPSSLSLPAGAVNLNLVGCCDWTDPFAGSFVGTVAPIRTNATPSTSATWEVTGGYTVGSAFDNAGAVLSARMTWNLTQAGSGGATSISGSFAAPPPAAVPEPATLLLLGTGLLTARLVRRSRR